MDTAEQSLASGDVAASTLCMKQPCQEHRNILEALLTGGPAAAACSVAEHCERSKIACPDLRKPTVMRRSLVEVGQESR